jgi:hypothetical protein
MAQIIGVIIGVALAVVILASAFSLGWTLFAPAAGLGPITLPQSLGAVLVTWALGAAFGTSRPVGATSTHS